METKTFSLLPHRLQIRRASLILGQELKAIKITTEQGHAFKTLTSFEEMLAKYGYINRLKEGEPYQGYIAIDYGGRQEVVYLKGHLSKASYSHSFDHTIRKACAEGRLWQVTTGDNCTGVFNYVWTFRYCQFNRVIDELKDQGKLCGELSSEELQDKIVDALCKNQYLEFTSDEELVLRCYLGDYFKKFFVEL